jgi:hypothetical protein
MSSQSQAQPPYSYGKKARTQTCRGLGEIQTRSGHFDEKKYLSSLWISFSADLPSLSVQTTQTTYIGRWIHSVSSAASHLQIGPCHRLFSYPDLDPAKHVYARTELPFFTMLILCVTRIVLKSTHKT